MDTQTSAGFRARGRFSQTARFLLPPLALQVRYRNLSAPFPENERGFSALRLCKAENKTHTTKDQEAFFQIIRNSAAVNRQEDCLVAGLKLMRKQRKHLYKQMALPRSASHPATNLPLAQSSL
jgi:hypothetical protein